MSDSRDNIRALWCRQLSGQSLSEDEERRLDQALREDPDLLRELSKDATSHALLLSVSDVTQTADDFLQAVMQKTMVQPQDCAVADEASVGAVAAAIERPRSGANIADLPQPAASSRSRSRRRRSEPWLAVSLTLVLFVSVSLVFWFQKQNQPELVEADSPATEGPVDPLPVLPRVDPQSVQVPNQDVADTNDDSADNVLPGEEPDFSATELAANDNVGNPEVEPVEMTDPDLPDRPQETFPAEIAQPFVTLTKLQNPVWEREDTVGSRLGNDVVRLFGGVVELTFDDGAVVTLEGPVEFQPRTAGQLQLRRGHLSAAVPAPAIGFTVLTPTSEVVDLGTEFEVSVKDTGASDVIVRKGEVEVAPGGRDGKGLRRWKLVPDGLNRASFFARADDGEPGPLSASVQGVRGQFHGIISINGRTAEFRSPEAFNNVRGRVMAEFEKSREDMQRQWQGFVQSMQKNMQGTMQLNGAEVQFGNMQEVMRLQNQMQQQMNGAAGGATKNSFSGSINVNGRVLKFTSREEYEAARRDAFRAGCHVWSR